MDSRVSTVLAFGGVSVLMVLVHHLYVRARRRSARAALAAAPLYPVAAVAGMWVYVTAVFPYGGFNPTLIAWGVAEGLLAWTALVVAARLSERAAVP